MDPVKKVNANLLIAHHSFSSIIEFDSCQGLYWARKVEQLKDPPTDKMAFGRDFGSAVLKVIGVSPHRDSPSAQDFGRAVAPEASLAAEAYVREAKAAGFDFTGAVAERPLKVQPDDWDELCRYYKVEGCGLGRPLVGYPDLELGDGTLVELKTTERLGYQPNYTIQTLLYVLGLHVQGRKVARLSVHQFKRTKTTQEVAFYDVPLRYEWFQSTLNWYQRRLNELESVISKDTSPCELKLSTGWWCGRCPKSLTCHLYQSTLVTARNR